jgi:hypothetical protein
LIPLPMDNPIEVKKSATDAELVELGKTQAIS